jgi:hypothetical protein
LDATNLRVLVDPADPITLGTALTEVTAAATDVLVVYYVGHGLVSAGNELHLATTATDDHSVGLAFKALPFSAVRDALARCHAASIMVVLDCCFAGRAYGSLGSPATDGFTAAQLRGSYLLAAAAHDEAALTGPGEPHTAFSGALLPTVARWRPDRSARIDPGIQPRTDISLPRRAMTAPPGCGTRPPGRR